MTRYQRVASAFVPALFATVWSGASLASAASAIDQSNLAPTTGYAGPIFQGKLWGQVFTAGNTGYLTQVDVSLDRDLGSTGSELFFQVLGLDSTGAPDMLQVHAHRLLSADLIPLDQGLTTPVTPISVDLTEDLIWMQPGQKYAIAVSRFAPGVPPWVSVRTTVGVPGYTGGSLFTRESGDDEQWSEFSGGFYDMGFQTWADPAPDFSGSNSVEVRPVFDAAATREPNTSEFFVSDGQNGLILQNFGNVADEERAILEYKLPRLPEGAVVTGARLNLRMYGGSGSPSIAAHPYLGNGQLDPADALQFGVPFYSTGEVRPVGDIDIELGPEAVNSMYSNNQDYLGFMLRVENSFKSGAFNSLESNLFNIDDGADIPALVIDYIVPLLGDLDADGFVGIADLNIVLSAWNQAVPPGDPLADPSGDGFVGIDDLNLILGNWNAGSPPSSGATTNIPEPATSLIFTALAAVHLRRSTRKSSA